MSKWQQKIHLNPEWDDAKSGALTVHALASIIGKRLKGMPAFRADLDDERNEIAEEFLAFAADPNADVEDFDCIMDQLYDWGDISLDNKFGGKKCCWIDTMSNTRLSDGDEPLDPMRGVEFPFAENH